MTPCLFDEANLLARAIGVRLEKNDSATMKRIVLFKDGQGFADQRPRPPGRPEHRRGHQPRFHAGHRPHRGRTDRPPQHAWTPSNGSSNASMTRRTAQFRATLEALIRTTKPGHDDHQAQRNLWQALYGEEAAATGGVVQPASAVKRPSRTTERRG